MTTTIDFPMSLSRTPSRDLLFTQKPKKKLGSLSNLGQKECLATGQLRIKSQIKEESEIYTIKFSPGDEVLAYGMGDGRIKVISPATTDTIHTLTTPLTNLPCTSLAFRPINPSYKTQNVLAASYASGHIIHYHIHTGQILSTISESSPDSGDNQQTNCVVYNAHGTKFASGGSDCWVRVYDGVTLKEETKMIKGSGGTPEVTAGHSNRIFAVRFHPTEPWCLISAGWDDTVQVWDTRIGHSVASVHGPHICGDALDFSLDGTKILTGSYRKENPLQIWTLQNPTTPIQTPTTLPWSIIDPPSPRPRTLLYSAQYSRTNKYILAGGGGIQNQVKLYSTQLGRPVGMVTGLPATIYSTAMSGDETRVVFGGGDRGVTVCEVDLQGLAEFVF